jgi:hypothetical protein
MRKSFTLFLFASLLIQSSTQSFAETTSDRVSSKIASAGLGGFTRVIFEQNSQASNYSIQPNSNHQTFLSVLPVCSSEFINECIESLSYRKLGDTNWISGKVLPTKNPSMKGVTALSYSSSGTTQLYGAVERNVSQARPYGDMSSSWSLEGASHAGGSEYLLSVSVSNFPRDLVSNAYDFSIKLNAVQWKVPPQFGLYDKTANSTTQFNLPQDIEFQVKIRIGMIENKIINWYNGRILNPSVDLENGVLAISGRPTYFPIAGSAYIKCSDLQGEKKSAILNSFGPNALSGNMCSDLSGSAFIFEPKSSGIFKVFESWDSELTEYGKNSAWSIEASGDLGACNSPELAGFVSSNALIYTVNPPSFDPVTRSLSYRIASTHLDSKGELNRGRFNLVISKKISECLWGLKGKELSEAKVEVTYSDGKPIVGTTTLTAKGDWVYINIENFTFSSPTFNIKATSVIQPEPSPTPSASPSAALPASNQPAKVEKKKTTITCIKGKLVKKVSSQNPKCPAGFKKK